MCLNTRVSLDMCHASGSSMINAQTGQLFVQLKMDGCITSKYTNERSLARKAMRGKHLKTAGDQNPATVKTSVHKFLAVEGVCMVGHALHICRNK